uniref:HIG1 domain-containing protein n=1 Tax=Rhizochromulina marina TaxID=1034831 RepID=A0A7S2W876_9STRA|mmetsp:Transcript_17322/g.50539  ORF Transcript_17322/g.50539 Transcript_17322/m.50539 type:complete len:228 (+) Transcript_17322:144-827(+)
MAPQGKITIAEDEAFRNQCVRVAVKEAAEKTVIVGIASTAAVMYLNQSSRWFRTSLGISGKVAMVMSPIVGTFFLVSEHTMSDVKFNPRKYGLNRDGSLATAPVQMNSPNVLKGQLMAHHRAANWAYDHPFHVLAGCAVPLVGSIFYSQTGHDHLKLSQKIMHTRVLGQASVVTLLLSVMFFRDYMDRHGRFKSLEDLEAEKVAKAHTDEIEAQELIREADMALKSK